MDPFKLLASKPRVFSLPVAGAFGMALGFYPGAAYLIAAMLLALAVSSLGLTIGPVAGAAGRLRRMQAISAALGLVAGAAAAWQEAGSATWNYETMPRLGAACATGAALMPLYPVWAEGRLGVDSSPAKNGFRSYSLTVERLGLAGKGVSAELSYPGRARGGGLRVLARAGPEIDAGSRIRVRGSFSAGLASAPAAASSGGPVAVFAKPRDLSLIDEGGPIDRGRSLVRDACRKALGRIGTCWSGCCRRSSSE